MERESWGSRASFILASIGSAVGLGNAWRFPGLCAKYGGGAFLVAYLICMVIIGIPLLMMEVAIGRKAQSGAPKAMRLVNKKAEPVGWAATANAFFILTYYVVVFAWCIMMCFVSYKFATSAKTIAGAQSLWQNSIGATFKTSLLGDGGNIKLIVFVCLILSCALVYFCIRNGAASVGKVCKYTVFIPILMLVVLALKGFINNPHLGEALKALFVPKWRSFGDPKLWVNAVGQAFYSLSIMMAIMFAYGSFLRKSANIAVDSIIIAFADLGVSVLSGIVLFTTMYSTGMTVDNMSASGISTAFIIYPTAIVMLTGIPVLNAIFGFIFYFMLCTLAIDSAFSILEGVATAVADKFKLNKRKTTLTIAIIAALISIIYITGAGVGWVDIVDNWTNQYTLIIIGVLETIVIGWCFKINKVLDEVNKNTKKFKMPKWWFNVSIKIISPLCLVIFFVWQFVVLIKNGFRYDTSYNLAAEIIGGWLITILVFASGFIIKLVCKKTTRGKEIMAMEEEEPTWDEITYNEQNEENKEETSTVIDEAASEEKVESVE